MTISTAPAPLAAKVQAATKAPVRKNRFWSWLIFLVGALYFLVPLAATFYWSLRAEKDTLGFEAYRQTVRRHQLPAILQRIDRQRRRGHFPQPALHRSHRLLGHAAIAEAATGVEFITLLPFVIPAVVLVFGLIRLYSRPPLLLDRHLR